MNFLLILNGDFVRTSKFNENFFNSYDKIICVDGGCNNFKELSIKRDFDLLIGDLDSIDKQDLSLIEQYKIIYKDNQDDTDSLFAIKHILNNFPNITNIDFIFSTSISRIDHLLCNILLLKQIPSNIKSKIITNNQEIILLKNSNLNLNNKLNQTISIIPLTNIGHISTNGLQWELDQPLNFGYITGISNIIKANIANIEIQSGEACIIITNKLNLN